MNTLDGENGPVLKHCSSIKLNSMFTESDMRKDGQSILKFQFCELGGHEFLFNVDSSGTYVFKSKMTHGGISFDLQLIVDVDSGIASAYHDDDVS